MVNETDINKSLSLLDSRIQTNTDGKMVVVSTNPSEVLVDISRKLVDEKLITLEASYELVEDYPTVSYTNGMKAYTYLSQISPDTTVKSNSKAVIGDWDNTNPVTAAEEVVQLVPADEYHIRYTLYDQKVLDFGVGGEYALNISKSVAQEVELGKEQYKNSLAWKIITDNIKEVDSTVDMTTATVDNSLTNISVEKSKIIENIIIENRTAGPMEAQAIGTATAFVINPVQRVESDAIMYMNKKFASNYKFDVKGGVFSIGDTTYGVGKIKKLDFAKIETRDGLATGTLDKYEVIMVMPSKANKNAIEFGRQYMFMKSLPTGRNYTTFHIYEKINAYKYKDALIYGFLEVVAAPASASKK